MKREQGIERAQERVSNVRLLACTGARPAAGGAARGRIGALGGAAAAGLLSTGRAGRRGGALGRGQRDDDQAEPGKGATSVSLLLPAAPTAANTGARGSGTTVAARLPRWFTEKASCVAATGPRSPRRPAGMQPVASW